MRIDPSFITSVPRTLRAVGWVIAVGNVAISIAGCGSSSTSTTDPSDAGNRPDGPDGPNDPDAWRCPSGPPDQRDLCPSFMPVCRYGTADCYTECQCTYAGGHWGCDRHCPRYLTCPSMPWTDSTGYCGEAQTCTYDLGCAQPMTCECRGPYEPGSPSPPWLCNGYDCSDAGSDGPIDATIERD